MSLVKDLYFVAVKVFLVDNQDRLLITKDKFGDWDIPGGRLRENDFSVPLAEVVSRKLREELGEDIKYSLGEPVVFMRHERNEILADGSREPRRIFAVGYLARYLQGEIKLGKNHETYEWVPLASFVPAEYFSGGWLAGVQEFQNKYRSQLI